MRRPTPSLWRARPDGPSLAAWRPALVLVFLLGTLASAASADPPPAQPLTICYYPTELFFFPQGKGWTGLEHDILERFAEQQGRSLRYLAPGNLENLFDALRQSDCEIVAATVTRTAERLEAMDFSAPYFPVRIMAVEPRDSLTSRVEQLRGKVAAVHHGSSYIEALDHIGDVEKLWVDDVTPSFHAVSRGEADFLACDSAFVLAEIRAFPDLRITVPLSERQYFAFALSKGSELTAPLSRLIHSMLQDGTLRELLSRYYDPEGVDLILQDGFELDESEDR